MYTDKRGAWMTQATFGRRQLDTTITVLQKLRHFPLKDRLGSEPVGILSSCNNKVSIRFAMGFN